MCYVKIDVRIYCSFQCPNVKMAEWSISIAVCSRRTVVCNYFPKYDLNFLMLNQLEKKNMVKII